MSIELDRGCHNCGQANGFTSEATGYEGRMPEPGDPMICAGCGGFGVYGRDLVPRYPTQAEMNDFMEDQYFLAQVGVAVIGIAASKGQSKIKEN